jgi:bifunctional DNase/RNase
MASLAREASGERYLPMWVAADQAEAILTELAKVTSLEPLTHDFICSLISKLGAVLKYVVVDELTEETFHAKAFLEREGNVIEIDCRPSDAIATALRAKMPIFVTEKLLEEAAISIEEINKTDKQ